MALAGILFIPGLATVWTAGQKVSLPAPGQTEDGESRWTLCFGKHKQALTMAALGR
jgi:hypothetical protein